MTEEQILELAKKHLEVLVADDDEMKFPTDFAATKAQLITFADQIYLTGWREGYEVCLNKLNPSIEDLIQSCEGQ
jgi:hypothetical protein